MSRRWTTVRLLVDFVDGDGRQHAAGERRALPAELAAALVTSGGAEVVNGDG